MLFPSNIELVNPIKDPSKVIPEQKLKEILKHAISTLTTILKKEELTKGDKLKARNNLLIIVASFTGLRVGELILLRKGDLIKQGDFFFLAVTREKKRNFAQARDLLPIPEKVAHIIKEYCKKLKLKDTDFLFWSQKRKGKFPITRQRVWQLTRQNLNIHPHQFRHTLSVMLVQNVKDIEDIFQVKEQLGHSSLLVTLAYYVKFKPKKRKNLLEDILLMLSE